MSLTGDQKMAQWQYPVSDWGAMHVVYINIIIMWLTILSNYVFI